MKTSVKLPSGQEMPLLGLGCWLSPKEEVANAVKTAILCGYRHIDTAYVYDNEEGVGQGIREAIATGKVKREDLFIVTKLPLIGMRADKVERFLKKSLSRLELDYVDLYLIHFPCGLVERSEDEHWPKENDKMLLDNSTDHIAIWKAMEAAVDAGLTKNIGISNFSARQTRKIAACARIKPATNQVECSVYFQQRALRAACDELGVVLTAYGPLGSPGRKLLYEQRGMKIELPDPLSNPVVRLVADKHQRTPAHVLLRFLAQQDVVVIPKSTNEKRIQENAKLFDFQLDEVDMAALKSLDQGDAGRTFKFDVFAGIEEHPEFSL